LHLHFFSNCFGKIVTKICKLFHKNHIFSQN
jgi:hypothetical protein